MTGGTRRGLEEKGASGEEALQEERRGPLPSSASLTQDQLSDFPENRRLRKVSDKRP